MEQLEEMREQDSEGEQVERGPRESIAEEQKENESPQLSGVPPSDPVYVRRNPPRDRHPPKRLSYQLRAMDLESVQQKVDRGRKIWQRAKGMLSRE